MTDVGIMQGHLLPPFSRLFYAFSATWKRYEFHYAHEAGLARIRLIYKMFHKKKLNPESGVGIRSTCVSCYMHKQLFSSDGTLREATVDRQFIERHMANDRE